MRPPLKLSAKLAFAAAAAAAGLGSASDILAQGRYDRIARKDADVTPASVDQTLNIDRSFESNRYDYGTPTTSTLPSNLDPRKVADALAAFSREMNSLYAVLRAEERSVPSLRSYLVEVQGYAVDADLLARDLKTAQSLARHEAELRELDSGWNRTSRRLVSIPGLSRTAAQAIQAVDAATKTVESSLNIGSPTLDRKALVDTAVQLRTAVRYLSDTIEFTDAIPSSAERNSLRINCNQARLQADRMFGLVFDAARPDRAYLIEEYRKFTQLMNPVIGKLRGNPDRALGRDVRNVQDYQRQFADLLLIDRGIDADQLGYMVSDLQQDVERFFNNTTLELLRDIPRNEEALASGNAFWGTFANFTDTMANSKDPADWSYAYGFIDEQWRDFRSIFSEINSEQARADLKEIEAGMNALRESLNLTGSFDRGAVADLAARIETNAVSIKRDAEAWLRVSRPSYTNAARADMVDYELKSRAFHEAVVNGRPLNELRQMETDLFEQWKLVYGHIKNCDTRERAYLASSARDTTPAFREVQVALAK
ncbi:hypothetical protein [Alienimonas californiensis]|uniref:Uncharacterized protein n=1 Tax=Alienimonas californiensis TaxID=2527989 RepID=A0A517P998_9PLAN|nr:hypothetical protein [Alienimonas californiensis]QDT15938.1 hypothetical protein CA12_20360 [Alienimonas californiensis]